jgi:hypothetical protein
MRFFSIQPGVAGTPDKLVRVPAKGGIFLVHALLLEPIELSESGQNIPKSRSATHHPAGRD